MVKATYFISHKEPRSPFCPNVHIYYIIFIILYYIILYYIILYYIILYYIILRYVMLRVLCYIILCYVILFYILYIQYIILYLYIYNKFVEKNMTISVEVLKIFLCGRLKDAEGYKLNSSNSWVSPVALL